MNDQISDFIIRIKNAAMARRRVVSVPFSKTRKAIAKILLEEHFLSDIKEETEKGKKILRLGIAYEERIPVLTDVTIISKPSLRVYAKAKNVKNARRGLGISILSTNQGILSEKEAHKKKVGGQLLFKVW